MEIELGSFKGEGGVPIHTIDYTSDKSVADVVLFHGYGEHSERYRHVAKRLLKSGYDVHLHDHRGHGRSGAKMGHIDSFERLVIDCERRVDEVRLHQPDARPLFVLGHSMGGLAAMTLLARGLVHVDAAAISAVFILPGATIPGILVQVSKVLGLILPMAPVQKIDSSTISRDEEVVARYDSDPLVFHGSVDARTGSQFVNATEWLQANLGNVTTPVLIMHGTGDRLIKPESSQIAHDGVSSSDLSLKWYDGLYHEILNEPEGDAVLDDVIEWFDAHR